MGKPWDPASPNIWGDVAAGKTQPSILPVEKQSNSFLGYLPIFMEDLQSEDNRTRHSL